MFQELKRKIIRHTIESKMCFPHLSCNFQCKIDGFFVYSNILQAEKSDGWGRADGGLVA